MNYPFNETYNWDQNEGVIGVLGVAPAATADFYQRVTRLIPAKKDWQHIRVLIDSNPKLPSRGRHLELGEANPSPFIREGILGLLASGASIVAIPCNTAHILYDQYAVEIEPKVPHMIDLAVRHLISSSPPPQRLAVLGSRLTNEYDLYGKRLRDSGGGILPMNPWQEKISSLIEFVKQGGDLATAAESLNAIVAECEKAGADSFVVACSEISAIPKAVTEMPMIDSSESLAKFCVETVTGRETKP